MEIVSVCHILYSGHNFLVYCYEKYRLGIKNCTHCSSGECAT